MTADAPLPLPRGVLNDALNVYGQIQRRRVEALFNLHRAVFAESLIATLLSGAVVSADPAHEYDLTWQRDGDDIKIRFGVTWRAATGSAGASGVRYHDLRHTFASTLLSNGVSIKAVADWLGHSSPTITLSTYAHLMPVDEDRARAVLEDAFARRAEDQLRTSVL